MEEDKIEVGEYVRTKRGYIGKVIKIRERIETYKNDREAYLVDWGGKRATCISQIKDIKHSKNIIDLIEVGDYVNGYFCKRIPNFNNEMCNFDLNTMEWTPLKNIDIWENIVTKEQFKSIEYRLED